MSLTPLNSNKLNSFNNGIRKTPYLRVGLSRNYKKTPNSRTKPLSQDLNISQNNPLSKNSFSNSTINKASIERESLNEFNSPTEKLSTTLENSNRLSPFGNDIRKTVLTPRIRVGLSRNYKKTPNSLTKPISHDLNSSLNNTPDENSFLNITPINKKTSIKRKSIVNFNSPMETNSKLEICKKTESTAKKSLNKCFNKKDIEINCNLKERKVDISKNINGQQNIECENDDFKGFCIENEKHKYGEQLKSLSEIQYELGTQQQNKSSKALDKQLSFEISDVSKEEAIDQSKNIGEKAQLNIECEDNDFDSFCIKKTKKRKKDEEATKFKTNYSEVQHELGCQKQDVDEDLTCIEVNDNSEVKEVDKNKNKNEKLKTNIEYESDDFEDFCIKKARKTGKDEQANLKTSLSEVQHELGCQKQDVDEDLNKCIEVNDNSKVKEVYKSKNTSEKVETNIEYEDDDFECSEKTTSKEKDKYTSKLKTRLSEVQNELDNKKQKKSKNSYSKAIIQKLPSFQIIDEDEDDAFTSTPDGERNEKVDLISKIKDLEYKVKVKRQKLDNLKRVAVYKSKHNVEELTNLAEQWKQGCLLGLNQLLNKLQSHTNIDMPTLLRNLHIQDDMVARLFVNVKF